MHAVTVNEAKQHLEQLINQSIAEFQAGQASERKLLDAGDR